MYVTKDKYELPIAVAESKRELAKMLGRPVNSVQSCFSKHYPEYIDLEVEDDTISNKTQFDKL